MLAMFPQLGGVAGVRQTLVKMAALTNGAFVDPLIRDQAAYAIQGCPQGNRRCYCYALLNWVNSRVRYVPDPNGVELLHDPRLMAQGIRDQKMVYGDCDDMSLYLGTLLKSVGIAPIYRAVGYDGKPYQHVYVVAEGLTLDATRSPWDSSFRPYQETSVLEERV